MRQSLTKYLWKITVSYVYRDEQAMAVFFVWAKTATEAERHVTDEVINPETFLAYGLTVEQYDQTSSDPKRTPGRAAGARALHNRPRTRDKVKPIHDHEIRAAKV